MVDPIQVLRIEREKLAKEQRRIQVAITQMDTAIEQLTKAAGVSASLHPATNLPNETNGGIAYGGWRDFLNRVFRDQGRFIQASEIVRLGRLAFPKLEEDRVKLSVRNALQGLKNEGGKAVPYRTGPGNHRTYWGLREFWDDANRRPKPGREPLEANMFDAPIGEDPANGDIPADPFE